MLFAETASGPDLFFLAPWIVFSPVIGLLLNLVFGKRFGERFVGSVASLASGGALVVSTLLFLSLRGHPEGEVVRLVEWITIGTLQLEWAFRVDSLSVTMMLVVSGVGTLIHIYAAGYMHYDVRYKEDPASYTRFFIYMNLFIAFMMTLVGGDNYLMLFVGWEGVGLCSFLLIGFWFTRNPDTTSGTGNSSAAKKAFITNRVGDFGFLIAMFLTFWFFGSLQFDAVFEEAHHIAATLPAWVIPAIGLFMLLGVTGKSAQIPLFVWLPDAMAGPTPVSALIHAATMVTAGVYLVTRSAPLFELSHELAHGTWYADASFWVALVGGVTALFAATIAVGQYDIKRVLAYSTVSQLGFMVAAVGLGAYVAGMFHLVTHAFFKALLFLGSGSVILGVERGHHPLESTGDSHGHHGADEHGHHHEGGHDDHGAPFDPQDMRNMGGLRKRMPVTFWVYMIGTIALAGLPPFAGFWSKDEILADAAAHNMIVYVLLTIAAFFTAFYMGRQIWLVFFGEPRTHAAAVAKESPPLMTVPLMILAFLSVFGGGLNLPEITEAMHELPILHAFGHWLEHTLGELAEAGDFNAMVAASSTALAIVAIAVSWLFYGRKPLKEEQPDPLSRLLGPIFVGMNSKWFVDEIYEAVLLRPYRRFAAFLADRVDWDFWHDWFHDKVIAGGFNGLSSVLAVQVDLGFVDRISQWLADGTGGFSRILSRLQSGFARNYALMVFLGVVVIMSYIIFR